LFQPAASHHRRHRPAAFVEGGQGCRARLACPRLFTGGGGHCHCERSEVICPDSVPCRGAPACAPSTFRLKIEAGGRAGGEGYYADRKCFSAWTKRISTRLFNAAAIRCNIASEWPS